MSERAILFSAPMVRAILEGRKTQTRRVVKLVRGFEHNNILKYGLPYAADPWAVWWHSSETDRVGCLQECPYGLPGDRLWVRETLRRNPKDNVWYYSATPDQPVMVSEENHGPCIAWAHHKEGDVCVSIHMPRWASRLTLEITAVRVERVQDISEEDAKAEGVEPWSMAERDIADMQISDCSPQEKELARLMGPGSFSHKFTYQMLWDELNGKRGYGFDANPWVWVVEFRRAEA